MITTNLLQALLSPDASQRQAAELQLRQGTVSALCTGLLQALQSQPSHLAHLAAVLLRREIIALADATQVELMIEPLLLTLHDHPSASAVGDCLAEVCASLQWLDPTKSVEAVQHILKIYPSQVSLWIAVAERAPKAFSASGAWHLLPSPQHQETFPWLKLLVATATAIDTGSENSPASQLGHQYLLPVLPLLPKQGDLWELLIQAADDVPALLTGPCLLATLELCANKNLQAVQVVATLLAVPSVQVVVRNQPILDTVLSTALATCWDAMQMGVADDEKEWALEPVPLQDDALHEGDDEANLSEALLSELIRLSPNALAILLPVLEGAFQHHVNDWKVHRAALAALQCCVEVVPIAFEPHVPHATQVALRAARHSNSPRVQYQAVQLLGVMCESISAVRESHAAQLLETFSRATHSSCTKIAAIGCQALVSYCRPADPKVELDADTLVIPFLHDILQALVTGPLSLNLTDSGAVVVQVRAIGAVACLAQASGPAFAPFYSRVMPGLLACAQISTGGNHEKMYLAGSSLETATIVGQAIGDDYSGLFAADAQMILKWAVPALQQQPTPLPMDQLLSACARIASVLGESYLPYVENVLPHLLRRATDPADVEFSDGDVSGRDAAHKEHLEVDEESGTQSMTVAIPGRGLTKLTINTTKIQEKAHAARAVYEHAVALGSCFGQYSKPCLDAFLPLVFFKYSSEIRATAAQTLAAVFDSACSYGESTSMDIPTTYLPLLVKSIAQQVQEEDTADRETVFALANSLSDLFRTTYLFVAHHGSKLLVNLSQEDLKGVVSCCMKSMVSCLERRAQITRILAEGPVSEYDERNELDARLKREEELLTPFVDLVGYALKCFGEAFVPIFESEIAPLLGSYLGTGNDIRARLSAVCLFDDVIEHCGSAAAAKFGPLLVEGIINGLSDAAQDSELTRASIYGIAQIARHTPASVLTTHAQYFAQRLCLITDCPKEQSDDVAIYENAMSALASLLLFNDAPFRSAGFVKRETLIRSFLNSLPLREDEDEAKVVHAGLCDLIEHAFIDVDAEHESLVRIITETLSFVVEGEELASSCTCARLNAILSRLQQNSSVSSLRPEYGFANVISP